DNGVTPRPRKLLDKTCCDSPTVMRCPKTAGHSSTSANTTGDDAIRAGLPAEWTIGDKTGGGIGYGTTNDIAITRPRTLIPSFSPSTPTARTRTRRPTTQ